VGRQRVADAVDGSDTGHAERLAGQMGAEHEREAGLKVGAVLVGDGQPLADQVDGLGGVDGGHGHRVGSSWGE
jgi:hypothetical protein